MTPYVDVAGVHEVKQDPFAKVFDPKLKAQLTRMLEDTELLGEQARSIRKSADDAEAHRMTMNTAKAPNIARQLALYGRDMNATNSKAFIQTLDAIDDKDLRQKVQRQFQLATGQSLEHFIQHCEGWNNDGPHRDKHAALQLIDRKRDDVNETIRTMPAAERAQKQEAAAAYARTILSGTYAHDDSLENQQKILGALQGRDAVEIEMIRAAIRESTHRESNLYQMIDNGMRDGAEDEAVTMLAGDRIASAHAVFDHEMDPERRRSVLQGLKPEELKQLQTPSEREKILRFVINPADRAELSAMIDGNTDKANSERLGNLLKDPKSDLSGLAFDANWVAQDNYKRRDSKKVLEAFESMSGDEVRAAADMWNQAHPKQTFESMLKERWGDDAHDVKKITEYGRLLAMIKGDKAANRSIRLQLGMQTNDQELIEAALAHDTVTDEQRASKDPEVLRNAAAIARENAAFEMYNVTGYQAVQRTKWRTGTGGSENPAATRTKDQLAAHYEARADKERITSIAGVVLGGGAEDMLHERTVADANADHWAAQDLYADGKLSRATQIHRGKDAKEQAEALETIQTAEEWESVQKDYEKKFKHPMFRSEETHRDLSQAQDAWDKRSKMTADELVIDNIRRYGPRATRPAQLEYLLQAQQYKRQYSQDLEMHDKHEAGGGVQTWQRQQLDAEREVLENPTVAMSNPVWVGQGSGYSTVVDLSPSFDDIQQQLPRTRDASMADGLKDGVSKDDFNRLDEGTTEAHRTQSAAKKRLADRYVEIFTTVAKLTALVTANPWLSMLIDLGTGLMEMSIKKGVMGEAYDAELDARALLFQTAAEAAMLGISAIGKNAGAYGAGRAGAEAAKEGKHVDVEEIAKQIENRWKVGGKLGKTAINGIGGLEDADAKSALKLLRKLASSGVSMLTADGVEKVKAALASGDERVAVIVLEQIASGAFDAGVSTAKGHLTSDADPNTDEGARAGNEIVLDSIEEAAGDHAKEGIERVWAVDEDYAPVKAATR